MPVNTTSQLVLVTASMLAALASLGLASPAAAQDGPELHARAIGDDVLLEWSRLDPLAPGETWALYRAPMPERLGLAFEADLSPVTTTLETSHLDAEDPAEWPERYHYLVRVEGGAAGPGPWSNAAFRFDVELPPGEDGASALYLLSLPVRVGIEDRAAGTSSWPCTGSGEGDGLLRHEDAACALWRGVGTLTDGTFAFRSLDVDCEPSGAVGTVESGIASMAAGSASELDAIQQAFMASAAADPSDPPTRNRGVIAGSHEPGTGVVVDPVPCGRQLVRLPMHSTWRTLDEVLCGLEGVSWTDSDGDGSPDTCPGGLYDPSSGERVTVQALDWETQLWEARTAVSSGSGLLFLGTDRELRPGEGLVVTSGPTRLPTTLVAPHF